MKKILIACTVIAFALTGCNKKTEVTKVTDYLYEYEADGYGTEAPVLPDNGLAEIFCSSVRNGNFYGRNLDFKINEICEFVVRTRATAERKHASIGVANPVFLDITNEAVAAGRTDMSALRKSG